MSTFDWFAVQVLDLRYNDIRVKGAVDIATELKQNRSLFVLDLYGNNLASEGVLAIVNALVMISV